MGSVSFRNCQHDKFLLFSRARSAHHVFTSRL